MCIQKFCRYGNSQPVIKEGGRDSIKMENV